MSINGLSALYEGYLTEAIRAERARKLGEGIFGIGKKPSDDLCHDQFVKDVGAWLSAFLESGPDSSDVRKVLTEILTAPKAYPEPKSAYWMLIAVQGLVLELVPLLSAPDAEALASEYEAAYRRYERVPVQNQLLAALKKAAKKTERKRDF